MRLRSAPVSALCTTTEAPGMVDPEGSVTVPLILPDPAVCAMAVAAITQNIEKCLKKSILTCRRTKPPEDRSIVTAPGNRRPEFSPQTEDLPSYDVDRD